MTVMWSINPGGSHSRPCLYTRENEEGLVDILPEQFTLGIVS